MRRSLAILLVLFALCAKTQSRSRVFAMGNLQTVIHGETLFSTDILENRRLTGNLWCQVYENITAHPAEWITFTNMNNMKKFNADINAEHRGFLHFGKSSAEAAGKYRCDMKDARTGQLISGNLYAYSHPVIKNNASWPLKKSEKEEGTAEGPALWASYKTTAFIDCPVIGYPEPSVTWFKNNIPLEDGDRIAYNKQTKKLKIENIEEADAGIYRCVATNQFPIHTDGPIQSFQLNLDQELRVGDNYGWMLPLAIIIIILLLLFLVIFVCQRCTQYKADHYNVAERERALHNDQVPLKNCV